jgi:hypothetical protein
MKLQEQVYKESPNGTTKKVILPPRKMESLKRVGFDVELIEFLHKKWLSEKKIVEQSH